MKILGLKLCVSISTIVKCDTIIIIIISLSVVVVVVAVGVVAFSVYILFYAHVALIYPSGSFLFSHRKFKFVTAPLNANKPGAYITPQPRLLWRFYTSRLAGLF